MNGHKIIEGEMKDIIIKYISDINMLNFLMIMMKFIMT